MRFTFTLLLAFIATLSFAQNCTIDYSQNSPGIYPGVMENGTLGSPYNQEATILFPSEEGGDSFTSFKIIGVELPLGLTWECSNESAGCLYNVQQDPFACINIIGTPAEAGDFEMIVSALATKSDGSTLVYLNTSDLSIANAVGSNAVFSFEPNVSCENASVAFTLNNPSSYTPVAGQTTGISYNWDFGNGYSSTQATPPVQNYNGVGEYEVSLTQVIDTVGFRLKNVVIHQVGCDEAISYGNPDIYIHIIDGNGTIVHSTESSPNDANLPQTYTMNILLNNPPYSIRVMDDDNDNLWGKADDNCINGDENSATTPLPLPDQNLMTSTTMIGNNGSLNFTYMIQKDVEELVTTDVVKVYPNPETPIVMIDGTEEEAFALWTEDMGHVYHWNLDEERQHDLKGPVIAPAEKGEYAVIAVNEYGCYSVSDGVNITGILALETAETMDFNIYPNPTSDIVNIDLADAFYGTVLLSDLTGKIIQAENYAGVEKLDLNVAHLAQGIYTITIAPTKGVSTTKKLVVN